MSRHDVVRFLYEPRKILDSIANVAGWVLVIGVLWFIRS